MTPSLAGLLRCERMTENLKLRRKWTMRAHDKQVVLIKKPYESDIHVLTKALIWALFLPDYPQLAVEIKVGGRYKPDLVQFGENGEPVFWGEAGQVSLKKTRDLVNRYRSTHLVFAKWNTKLEPFQQILEKETASTHRSAPIDLISFPADSDRRFIQEDGIIRINFQNIYRLRF